MTLDKRTITTYIDLRLMGKSPVLQYRHPEETVTTAAREQREKEKASARSSLLRNVTVI